MRDLVDLEGGERGAGRRGDEQRRALEMCRGVGPLAPELPPAAVADAAGEGLGQAAQQRDAGLRERLGVRVAQVRDGEEVGVLLELHRRFDGAVIGEGGVSRIGDGWFYAESQLAQLDRESGETEKGCGGAP